MPCGVQLLGAWTGGAPSAGAACAGGDPACLCPRAPASVSPQHSLSAAASCWPRSSVLPLLAEDG